MTGQMSELIPLLMKKWMRKGGPVDFALVHVCRGIMRLVPLLHIPYENPRHRSESINIGALYDLMYVLEDREVIDINKAFFGDDPELERKITYLGKVTNRVYGELPQRSDVLTQYGLPNKKIILITLGRNNQVCEVSQRLLEIMHNNGVTRSHQILMVLDPYLAPEAAEALCNHPISADVRFLPFVPDLVDVINQSELIISRAGYNIVNEILLTGVKAVLIPESHGGGEQELRVRSIKVENVITLTEQDVFNHEAERQILNLLTTPMRRITTKFDKFAIGKNIIEDLEEWRASHRECR